MWDYLPFLYKDIPVAVIVGLITMLIIGGFVVFIAKGIKNRWRIYGRMVLFLYSLLMIFSTLVYRIPDNSRGYNFKPFWSYIEILSNGNQNLLFQNVYNILVFIPIGLIIGVAFRCIRWWQVLIAIVCFSLSIEVLQYYLRRGFAEFDDLLHNTLGCMIGYGLYLITISLLQKLSVKR